MEPTSQAQSGEATGRGTSAAETIEAASSARELRLHFACPTCQKWLSVPLRSAGMNDYCPGCGATLAIPPLDDDLIGWDVLHGSVTPAGGIKSVADLPPPPDEFELVAIEIRAFHQEVERRCELARAAVARDARVKTRDTSESTADYVHRVLSAMPATVEHRRKWMAAQVDPLRRQLVELQRKTFRIHDIAVELGAYHADAQYFPIRVTIESGDGPTTSRRPLKAPAELARNLYEHWADVRKLGTLGVGMGCRRVLRELSIIDTQTAEGLELKFDELLTESQAPVVAIACSPNGRHVAIGTKDGVEIHDLRSRPRTTKLRGTAGHSLSFHPDGRLLSIASISCTLWNVETGQPMNRLSAVMQAEFSPDGRWLLAGTRSGVSLVFVAQPELKRSIDDPGGEPIAWCSDGRFFLVQNRLLELPSCRPIAELPVSQAALCRFSRDGSLLALASRSGELMLFRVPDTSPAVRLSHPSPVRALAVSPDGRTLATGQGSDRESSGPTPLCLWDTQSGALVQRTAHPGPATALEFSADGAYLLVGAPSGRVRVFPSERLPNAILD